MPHCIIEYSDDLATHKEELLDTAFEALSKSELFKDEDIKVRLLEFQNYLVGGKKLSFLHSSLHILSGRSENQKKRLVEDFILTFDNYFKDNYSVPISLSVTIKEMPKETYKKRVLNLI